MLYINSVYCVPNIIEMVNICRNYSHMKKVGVFWNSVYSLAGRNHVDRTGGEEDSGPDH